MSLFTVCFLRDDVSLSVGTELKRVVATRAPHGNRLSVPRPHLTAEKTALLVLMSLSINEQAGS